MHAHIPNPKFMVLAETSTFSIFWGRNVCGRNVQAEMSVAEMSVAEMSEHHEIWSLKKLGLLHLSVFPQIFKNYEISTNVTDKNMKFTTKSEDIVICGSFYPATV